MGWYVHYLFNSTAQCRIQRIFNLYGMQISITGAIDRDDIGPQLAVWKARVKIDMRN